MKRSDLSKVVGAGVLSVSLAILPLAVPAHAQSSTGTSGSSSGTTSGSTVDNTRSGTYDTRSDNNFDWGWLGLLGLAGLAGLIPRKREETVRYRETDEVSRPGSRL